jgi:hypothetical protein
VDWIYASISNFYRYIKLFEFILDIACEAGYAN